MLIYFGPDPAGMPLSALESLTQHIVQEAEVALAVPQVAQKAGAKKGTETQDAGVLALGGFSLQPATAALAVGDKQTISVTFSAQGAKLCLQQVGIDISDR